MEILGKLLARMQVVPYIYIINNDKIQNMKKQTLTIGRVKSENKVEETFSPMEWLVSGREWVIERILESNKRSELVEVMTAVKEAVLLCKTEDEALVAMDDAILTTTFSEKKHQAFVEAQRESLKRSVFN